MDRKQRQIEMKRMAGWVLLFGPGRKLLETNKDFCVSRRITFSLRTIHSHHFHQYRLPVNTNDTLINTWLPALSCQGLLHAQTPLRGDKWTGLLSSL